MPKRNLKDLFLNSPLPCSRLFRYWQDVKMTLSSFRHERVIMWEWMSVCCYQKWWKPEKIIASLHTKVLSLMRLSNLTAVIQSDSLFRRKFLLNTFKHTHRLQHTQQKFVVLIKTPLRFTHSQLPGVSFRKSSHCKSLSLPINILNMCLSILEHLTTLRDWTT